MNEPRRRPLTEDQMREVLARAIELDANGTTEAELRIIAREIGVSANAVDAALQECEGDLLSPSSQVPTPSAAAATAAGVPLGVFAGALLGAGTPLGAVCALGVVAGGLVASGAIIVLQGPRATLKTFLFRNLLLWAGLAGCGAATVALIGSGPYAMGEIMIDWGVRSWVASSILGSAAVIAVRRAVAPPRGMNAATQDVTTGSLRRRLARTGCRILDRASRILRRDAMHRLTGRTPARS